MLLGGGIHQRRRQLEQCRDSEERGRATVDEIKRTSGNDKVALVLADLSLLEQVRRAAAEIAAKHPKIDVLINNAGAIHTSRKTTPEGFEMTFATNHLAYFVLTNLLFSE